MQVFKSENKCAKCVAGYIESFLLNCERKAEFISTNVRKNGSSQELSGRVKCGAVMYFHWARSVKMEPSRTVDRDISIQ